jgi:hypothetical protein
MGCRQLESLLPLRLPLGKPRLQPWASQIRREAAYRSAEGRSEAPSEVEGAKRLIYCRCFCSCSCLSFPLISTAKSLTRLITLNQRNKPGQPPGLRI